MLSTQAFVPLLQGQSGPATTRSTPPAGAAPPSAGSSSGVPLTAAGLATIIATGALSAARGRRRNNTARAAADEEFCYGMVGAEGAWGQFNFDPLGLSSKFPEHVPWMREAELKHGRLAMLAWVGLVVPDVFGHLPGPEGWESCYGPDVSTVAAHNGCIGSNFISGPLAQPFVFVGLVEFLTTWPKMNYYGGGPGLTIENAGDYNLGKNFLPKDPEQAKQMRLKELKNGRLAMIAFGGAITQATITGNGFPWLFSAEGRSKEAAPAFGRLGASRPTMPRASRSAVARRAEEGEGYKMSKAVPFLPMSPALEGYAGEEEGFDPMGFSLALDIRWLREAELKHGRVAMLATLGWVVTDLGIRVPGPLYQCSTLEAHDQVLVKGGVGAHLLAWTGYFEFFSIIAFIQACEGKSDRAPGDFGLRRGFPTDEAGQRTMELKELRNGRLAMLAWVGIAGVATITGQTWPFFATAGEKKTAQVGSTFCGATMQSNVAKSSAALKALERSASVPFLPKPKGLEGMVGEETEFDPCCIAETYDIRWMREAELKHGRVCMLACTGFVVQQYVTWPGFTPQEDSLQAVYTAPQGAMAALLFVCGFIESSSYGGKITMLDMFKDTDREPGNFGLDGWFAGKDAQAVKTMKMKELKNGRLAMLAFGGMIHHNLVVSGPLFPTFPDGWEGPQGTWKAESIMDFLRTVNT